MSSRLTNPEVLRQDQRRRNILKWMIFLSILFHVGVLYAVLPGVDATDVNWEIPPEDTPIVLKTLPPPEKNNPTPRPLRPSVPRYVPAPVTEPIPLETPVVSHLPVPELPVNPENAAMEIPEPEPPDWKPYRPSPDVKMPVLIHSVEPVYPVPLRRLGIQGAVVLEAVVRRDGSTEEIRVLKSLHRLCDEAAIEAVHAWRFEPGTVNDVPVDVIMNLTVLFRIR